MLEQVVEKHRCKVPGPFSRCSQPTADRQTDMAKVLRRSGGQCDELKGEAEFTGHVSSELSLSMKKKKEKVKGDSKPYSL